MTVELQLHQILLLVANDAVKGMAPFTNAYGYGLSFVVSLPQHALQRMGGIHIELASTDQASPFTDVTS
ncbi:hypothetical protein V6N13_128170 [Hibiscus sabdariffa]|uniref:Uncharacterized protein n=1 Tax=Hibiscus sabdariffa TaxID=183260 RepID=A0ABR2P1Q0_9ROSI